MKITYVTHTRFPTEKAHGHQIAQVCAAIGRIGHDVTLVHPNIKTGVQEIPFAYYGVENNFKIEILNIFDALQSRYIPGPLAFIASMRSYRKELRKWFTYKGSLHEPDLFYCRSWEVLPSLLDTDTRVILELHALPRFFRKRFVRNCDRCLKIVCLTSALRQTLVKWGVNEKKIIMEPDGVDLSRFDDLPPYQEARDEHIPKGYKIIGYCGSFFARNSLEKGVGEILNALVFLKQQKKSCFGYIVGGSDNEKEYYKKKAFDLGLTRDDVYFSGRVSAIDVPTTIAGFDICVYPAPQSKDPYFFRDTSPLKLFEYLASGRPIVCADLPSIRDIVTEDHVRFCKPGDPKSLADAITDVLLRYDISLERAKKGKRLVVKYDWTERMKRVLQGIN